MPADTTPSASAVQEPGPALSGCVRAYIWRDLAALPAGTPRDTRVPASPYPGLLWLVRGAVHLHECAGQPADQWLPRTALSGAHRHAYHSTSEAGGNFFCLAFQPGALALLTGRDLQPLTDRVEDAHDWLPAGPERAPWQAWLHAMHGSPDHRARVALCEAFLAPRWAAAAHEHAAWLRVHAARWERPARQALAQELGWTPRHLQRRVRQLTGLRPGEVERMLRAETALLAMRDANASALDAALHHGYADQAHFSREARALYERPPAALKVHTLWPATDADWMLRRN